MTAVILEIRDGVAVGVIHKPVRSIGRNCLFTDEAFDWPTLCGVTGHAYQEAALADLGHTDRCAECATANPKKKLPVTRYCEDCGVRTSLYARRHCRPCHLKRVKAPHGTRSRYTAKCRCELCTKAERDYQREYKRLKARERRAAA